MIAIGARAVLSASGPVSLHTMLLLKHWRSPDEEGGSGGSAGQRSTRTCLEGCASNNTRRPKPYDITTPSRSDWPTGAARGEEVPEIDLMAHFVLMSL